MPSGPKKRRAARRRRGGTNAAGEEDEFDGAGNNVSEMSFGDVKPEAVNEKGAKNPEPVAQIALESLPTVESEHVEKIKDVPVLDESVSVGSKAKESEHESVHDNIVVHAPVMESVGKKEKESKSEPVDQILVQSGSKETKGDGYGEVGEGAVRGPMEIVDHGFSVVKEGGEMSKEVVLQDPFQEPGVSASDQPQAIMADTIDQSVSEVNAERFIEDAQDSLEKPSEVDVSPDHEGVEKECVEVGESAGNDSEAMVKDVVSAMNKGVEVSMEGVLEERLEEPIERSSDEIQAMETKTLDQSNLKVIPSKEDQDSSIPDESVSETNVETSIRDGQDSLDDVFPVEDVVQRNECAEVGEREDHGPPVMLDNDVSVVKESEEMSIEGPLEETSESSSHEPQEMVKPVDELVLKKIRVKEAQDTSEPVESVIEMDVETKSIQDDQESFATPLGSPMSPIESDVILNGLWNEPIEHSLHEPHMIPLSETQDTSLSVESVNEVHIQEPLEDPQDSFREPPAISSSLVDVSHVEGIVQESEVGESASQESESISHDKPQLIPSSKTQDTSLPVDSVNEVHIQTPLEDPQDSIKEQPVFSCSPVDVSHVEGVVQESEDGESASHDKPQLIPSSETQHTSLPVESVNEVHIQTPMEDPQDSIKEPPAICSSLVDVSHVEGIVQESKVSESASQESESASASHDEPQLIPLSETQDTSLPVESVNDVHIRTPLEDPQDSFMEPPVISSSLVDVSNVEGIVQESEVGESASQESESASHDEPQLIHLSETQDTSLPVESINEVHIQTPLEDPQDSIKEPPVISSSLVDVSHVEGIVQESEVGESASHDEPQLIPLSETQNTFLPVESINEVHIQTPMEDPEDSFKEPPAVSSSLVDVSYVEVVQESEVGESAIHDECVFKEGGEISLEGVLEESFKELIEPSTYELQETVKTGHQSFMDDEDPFVLVESLYEENVNTSLKDTQYTLKEPLRESYMDDLSLVEGVVQGEVGESICQDQLTMVNHVESVLEDDEEESIEGVLEEPQTMVKAVESESGDSSKEPLESPSLTEVTFVSRNVDLNGYGIEPIEGSSHGPHVMVKITDDLVVSKEIDIEKSQDPSLRADFIEENGDTSLKEDQDSFKEPVGDSSTDDVSFMDHGQPAMVLNPDESAIKEYEEISMESVLEESLEEFLGSSSHEPVQTDDELVLKEITLDEAQDPSLLAKSVIEPNVRAYSKDDQGPSVLTDVSLVEGVVEGNNCVVGECTCDCALINHVVSEGQKMPLEGIHQDPFKEANGDSSHEPQEIVDTIDQLLMKTTSLKETQDPYVPVVPVSEVDVETSSKDGQDYLKELLESPSLEETSTIEGFVQFNGDGNEKIRQSSHEQQGDVTYVEGVFTGNKCDEEIPIEGVIEKPLEDPSGHSSDEIEAIVKTLDESVVKEMPLKEDTDRDSVSEANVETVSLKDVQEYSFKVSPVSSFFVNVLPVEGNEYNEVGESTTLVNPFVLGIEEDDEMSIEGDLEEPFEELDVSSSYEPQEIVKEVDQSVSKALYLTEVRNPSVPADSINEVNVETFFKDAQDSLTKGDVQGNKYDEVGGSACHGPPSMVNHDVSILEDEEICMECVLEEHFKELSEISSDELQAMLKTAESGIEANVEISSKDSHDYDKEPMGDSHMDDISPIEGVVQGNEYGEVEESTCDGQPTMVNHVDSVTKEDEEMSMEDVIEEPETTVRIVDQLVLEGIPTKKAHDPFVQVESKIEVNEESSFKEAQDSTKDLPNNLSLAEDHTQAMVKTTNDQVVPKEMPLEEAQDDSLSGESIIEENVETSLKDAQDSLKDNVSPIKGIFQGKGYDEGGENGAIVTFVELSMTVNEDMSREVVLEERSKELIGSSLDDSDQSTPKERDILLEEDGAMSMESPSLGDISFDHVGESACHGSPTTVKHVVSDFKEDGVMSMEGVLEDAFEYPTRTSLLEAQAMVDTNDELVPNGQHLKEAQYPFVPVDLVIKVNVDTSFEDAEDSFETPLGSPTVGNVSHVEDFAELNGDQNDQVVSKVIPMEETQEPSLPTESVDEENVETSTEDAKDHSSMESLRSFPMADVSSIEGFVHNNERVEVGETACDGPLATVNHDVSVDSVLKDEKEVSMKDVLEESLKEPNEPFSDELQTKVKAVVQTVQDPSIPGFIQEKEYTEDGANVETSIEDAKDHSSMESLISFPMTDVSSIEGFVQDNERAEVGETACDGPLATVNHDVSVCSVWKDEKEVSMKDVLEVSLKEPNEPFSDELQTKVKKVDQTVQDTSVPGAIQEKEYTEDGANVETSIEDAKDHSSMESLRNFPMADVSSIEGFVQDNERAEVGETACDGPLATVNHDVSVDSFWKDEKEVSMKDVLEESLKEPNEPFSDELQTMVKTFNQTVQDPSVPGESNYEANLDTSLKYNQISLKEPLVSPFIFKMSPLEGAIQEKEYTEGGENATTVYHVESLAKEIKELSIEGDLEESFKDQVGHSSHEQESLVSSIVRSLLKEIPMKEDQDPYAPIESEVNVETSFQDVQDSESIGSPSPVDVFPSEEIVQGNEFEKVDESAFHGLPVMANHVMPVVKESEGMLMEGCSLVNGSSVEAVGQRNGQRNEMVGLVRTLLEEIRRIRAFYEEGLRQTTEIHLHMSQVLEKFDSDKLI